MSHTELSTKGSLYFWCTDKFGIEYYISDISEGYNNIENAGSWFINCWTYSTNEISAHVCFQSKSDALWTYMVWA